MNAFVLKTLSAFILWIISICFGIVFPYFIWKISPHESSRRDTESEDENSDRCDGESDNLILNRSLHRDQQNVIFRLGKRFASWIKVRFTNGKFLSLVNCLCGGVFLGVSLLDLMPQSRSAVSLVLVQSKIDTDYPVAEFMVALGLLLVMIVENLVSYFMSENDHKKDFEIHHHCSSAQHRSVEEHNSVGMKDNISTYRMYVLVITLSLHAIFEGLAIGLQKELANIIQLVIAISVHKAVLSFGIGLPLFETLANVGKIPTAISCAMIFCTASPVGCVIGAFVSTDDFNKSSGALIAGAVLQCLATGTFLYVTFVEMIPREFSHHAKEHSHKGAELPAEIIHTCSDESNGNDSAMEERCDESFEHSVHVRNTDRRPMDVNHSNKHTKRSQVLKLLALVVGFAIASGLQFL